MSQASDNNKQYITSLLSTALYDSSALYTSISIYNIMVWTQENENDDRPTIQ